MDEFQDSLTQEQWDWLLTGKKIECDDVHYGICETDNHRGH